MAKKVAIVQSNYIPWKGYFDMIAAVDEFILFDDVQYTRRDWRNRNKIKTPQGLQWLTVPVQTKGKYFQKIRETKIEKNSWPQEHWQALLQNYRRAPHFLEVAEWLEPLYCDLFIKNSVSKCYLSGLNRIFIENICWYLGIETRISNSWDYDVQDGKTERLVWLCKQAGGSEYVSGPSAKSYLNEEYFRDAGIVVSWFDYDGYPEYPQLWGDFIHQTSILDLLFNCGKGAINYMRHDHMIVSQQGKT